MSWGGGAIIRIGFPHLQRTPVSPESEHCGSGSGIVPLQCQGHICLFYSSISNSRKVEVTEATHNVNFLLQESALFDVKIKVSH